MVKFSVITVCLNAGKDLDSTVENVLNQTYKNYELIIKDGLSSDGSIERIPKDSKIKFISKKDKGIYYAMNQAVDEATGDYLIFMNAGDGFYDNEVLEKYAKFIDDNPADFYYGRYLNLSTNVLCVIPEHLSRFYCFRAYPCHQTAAFSKKCFANRRYDTNFIVCAENDIMTDIILCGKYRVKYVPFIVANYKSEGFSADPEKKDIILQEHKMIRHKYFSKAENFKYNFILALTFPHIRNFIYGNPKLHKLFNKFLKAFYRVKN